MSAETPEAIDYAELAKRVRAHCVGTPAKIPWPHRILHEAADALEAASKFPAAPSAVTMEEVQRCVREVPTADVDAVGMQERIAWALGTVFHPDAPVAASSGGVPLGAVLVCVDELEKIVCTKDPDRGVVLLSADAPTEYDPIEKCQVYKHENFSPLGDALISLHDRLTSLAALYSPPAVPPAEEACEWGTAADWQDLDATTPSAAELDALAASIPPEEAGEIERLRSSAVHRGVAAAGDLIAELGSHPHAKHYFISLAKSLYEHYEPAPPASPPLPPATTGEGDIEHVMTQLVGFQKSAGTNACFLMAAEDVTRTLRALQAVRRLASPPAELEKLRAENERLREELRPYQPMGMDEIEAALAELECDATPMGEDEIQRHVRFATDPVYRAEHLQERLTAHMRVNRGLRSEIDARASQLAALTARIADLERVKERMAKVNAILESIEKEDLPRVAALESQLAASSEARAAWTELRIALCSQGMEQKTTTGTIVELMDDMLAPAPAEGDAP